VTRGGVKKAVFGAAIAALTAAVLTLGLAIWAATNLGGSHVATASLFATVFFFGCCAIVLYFISIPAPPIPPEGESAGQ
jgi:hypothetical protein